MLKAEFIPEIGKHIINNSSSKAESAENLSEKLPAYSYYIVEDKITICTICDGTMHPHADNPCQCDERSYLENNQKIQKDE